MQYHLLPSAGLSLLRQKPLLLSLIIRLASIASFFVLYSGNESWLYAGKYGDSVRGTIHLASEVGIFYLNRASKFMTSKLAVVLQKTMRAQTCQGMSGPLQGRHWKRRVFMPDQMTTLTAAKDTCGGRMGRSWREDQSLSDAHEEERKLSILLYLRGALWISYGNPCRRRAVLVKARVTQVSFQTKKR